MQSGKLDINYDIYRIPSGLNCTTDGVTAFAVTAFVRYLPSGQQFQEAINGPFDPTTEKLTSIPLEFDVPADATSAQLWFLDSSECNGDEWDSNYGSNYDYPVYTEQQPGNE